MMVQATEDMGKDSAAPSDSHSTPIISQPSSSKPQKKNSKRKQRKDSALTEPTTEETPDKAHVSTPSYDSPQSVTLVDETQEMNDDNLMFNTGVLEEYDKMMQKGSSVARSSYYYCDWERLGGKDKKKHIEIVKDDEVAIDAIPLATKPPMIVEYKIVKEGQKGFYHLIRADGSSKRPTDDYERVFWGDLKVMFEPDIKIEL
ncbi:hypothetical protein Tco_0410381 [Tanacetum coccineum]